MEELIRQLVATVRQQNAVASSTLGNGMRVFAYPLEDGCALLGLGGDTHAAPATLLARRAARLDVAGGWLPALFADGSVYVLRRLAPQDADDRARLAEQVAVALEILD